MTTSIDGLKDDLLRDTTVLTEETYTQIYLDLSLPLDIRMESLKFFKTIEEASEFLKRLVSIFSMSMSRVIQEYIREIAVTSPFPVSVRLELARDFTFCKDDDDSFFQPLDALMPEMINCDIPSIKKVEAICALMRCRKYRDSALLYWYCFLDNQEINCEYRYKTIVSLRNTYNMRKMWVGKEEQARLEEDYEFFDKHSLFHFALNCENSPTTRILASQAIMVKYRDCENVIADSLLAIARDPSVEYNTRADATDVVLRYGTDREKDLAKEIIMELGRNGKGEVRTIYENAQNAHGESIEKSAIECFEKIAKIKLIKKNETDDIDFDYVVDQLGDVPDDAIITLNRIGLDNALYTKFSCSLKTALVVMYSFIRPSVYYETLRDRLVEELVSSAGICSSGIFERIMNVPSGIIDDMSLTISFEEQIAANLTGRLNARVRTIIALPCMHKRFCDCKTNICEGFKQIGRKQKRIACNACVGCLKVECIHECGESDNCNEILCDKILEEMVVPSREHLKRKNFLKFFNTYISEIMEELRGEFKEYMDNTTFELYMQRAILQYIGDN